jgi:hypothetical protein
MKRILPIACIVFLGVSGALAAPGGGDAPPGGSGEPTPRRLENDVSGDVGTGQRGQAPTLDIEGKVLDAAGRPIEGVLVKAFADGLLSGSAKSAVDGSFRLAASLVETSGKGSAVLWFQSPHTEHLDGQVVLWTGAAAGAQGLFPPCTQIAPIDGGRMTGRVEVTLRTADERQKDVAVSDCLERAPTSTSPR